ncbi:PREDICTED: major royal jelly protein 3-like [Wasmannia auropunctata]|uniref:major royal jelly protein 3-like n=1 Tax=Wasmannia auropunctata TaxID=64793 RepID=UPI0005F0919D|nr:PREDICTED: major royal jelly protein 3-like [Wasmannia auropunctata]
MKHFLISILILSMAIMSFGVKLNLLYAWKYIDFLWESPQQRQKAIDFGEYNPGSIVLEDVDEAPDGRIFITAVKDKDVPATVMTVSNEKEERSPLLRPYPNWSWHTNKSCKGITAVYRICIKCNHIFVVDSGRIGNDNVCPPQLLIFDLSNDKLVKRINIPLNVANSKNGTNGLLTTPIVVAPYCENIKDTAIVFITDTAGYGLVVYNSNTSKFCRIETEFMKPNRKTFTIENISFNLTDGIHHLAIVHKDLYYSALAADKLYKIEISKLIDCSLSDSEANEVTQLAGTLSGQTGPIIFEECAILFSNFPETSIMCADATKKIGPDNMEVIVQNSEELQCIIGMKMIDRSHSKSMKILTNRCQHSIIGAMNINETNFRILSMDIAEIRKATNCFASCN